MKEEKVNLGVKKVGKEDRPTGSFPYSFYRLLLLR